MNVINTNSFYGERPVPVIFKLASGENVPLDGGYVYSQTYIYFMYVLQDEFVWRGRY